MNKFLKWLLIAIGAIAVLLVIAAVVLPLVVDPNNYKQEIRNVVHAETGRDLTIGDNIKWSVFPWVGLDLGDVTLSNPAGFGERPMLSIGRAGVSVKLMPLLHRQIELGKVSLQDMSLYLRRDVNGANNWEDLGSTQASAPANPVDNDTHINTLKIAQIEISNANIIWEDAGQTTELASFHLTTSEIELGQPFTLQGGFSVKLAAAELSGETSFEARAQTAADGSSYAVKVLKLEFKGQQGSSEQPIALDLGITANIHIDSGNDEAKISGLVLRFHNLTMNGQLDVTALTSTLQFGGDFRVPAFSPRSLMEKMGIKAPPTTLKSALSTLQAEMRIAGSVNALELRNLRLKFDRSNLEGNFKIENFEQPRLAFDFSMDQLNLDDYMATSAGESEASDLPVDTFRGFSGGGDLQLGKLTVAGLSATQVKLTLSSDGNGVRLDPISSRFYGGQQRGEVRIDASGDHPLLLTRQELTGVQAADLLQDLTGSARLEGTGNLRLDLNTDLSNDVTTRQALSGHFGMRFHDGAIVGINVAESIRKAKAALGQQPEATAAPTDIPKTDFSELSMSGVIQQGVMRSDDLMMRSPLLRVTGKGQINLVNETIHYRVKPVVVDTLEGQGSTALEDLKGVPIPIKLSGNLYAPNIAFDFAAAITDSQKAKIKEKKKEMKDKVLGKLFGEESQSGSDNAGQSTADKTSKPKENDNSADALLQGLFGSKHDKNSQQKDKRNTGGSIL